MKLTEAENKIAGVCQLARSIPEAVLEKLLQQAYDCQHNQRDEPPEKLAVTRDDLRHFAVFRNLLCWNPSEMAE